MVAAVGIARRAARRDAARSPALALCQNNAELMIVDNLRSYVLFNAEHV
jgi:hypothetical protein